MFDLLRIYKPCPYELFIVELRFLIYLLETEMRISTANYDRFRDVFNIFICLGLALSGNFNDGRFVCDAGFILGECLMRVRMLIKLVDAQLVNAIVAAVSFGNGLAVFL
jgi:hypothetical protein